MGKSREGIKNDGRSKTRLYVIYNNMMSRCYYNENIRYLNYGGRGISICNEWLKDYNIFKTWALKNGYSSNLTIDRKDVNKNYHPDNCRWITNKEQQNNKTTNVYIEYKGKSKLLQQWSNELGICYKTLQKRIKKWGINRAFTEPINETFDFENQIINYNGKELKLCEWCEKLGLKYPVIRERIFRRQWSIERAFTTPERERRAKR